MIQSGNDHSRLDSFVAEVAVESAHRIGRRAALTRLGKGLLALVGASILNQLPQDRRVKAHHQAGCSNWKWCNLSGTPCSCAGGSNNNCPTGPGGSCSTAGTPWSGCCQDPSDCCFYTITYYDCCGPCEETSSPSCECDHGSQPYWCDDEANLVCTLAVKGPKCLLNCPC